MIKKTLLAATSLAFCATSALAGYTIYQDDAFPSVMFVEIEGGPVEEPTVISAPANVSADPALPLLTGDDDDNRQEAESAPRGDDEMPAGEEQAASEGDEAEQPTFEQRVERNVQLGDTTNQAVQRVINEEQLDEMELR